MHDEDLCLQAVAEALVEGDCYSGRVRTRASAQTSGEFGSIEGCERSDFSIGAAFGNTGNSDADAVCSAPRCAVCCALSAISDHSHFSMFSMTVSMTDLIYVYITPCQHPYRC